MADHLALTLKAVRYQDPSKIVTFFSRSEGLRTGFARGSTSRDNRFGAALEPLTLCRITGRQHGPGSLYRIHHSAIVDPFRGIHSDYNLLVWSGLVVRFLLGFLPADHPEPDLFSRAIEALATIDRKETPPELVWCRFAFDALSMVGYRIAGSACSRCTRGVPGEKIAYRPSDGTVACMGCFGREPASGWIMTSGPVLAWLTERGAESIFPEIRGGVRSLLDGVIREHLPRWIPVGDLSFLKEENDLRIRDGQNTKKWTPTDVWKRTSVPGEDPGDG